MRAPERAGAPDPRGPGAPGARPARADWLHRRPRRAAAARVRLVCFPFAGGGATAYHDLARVLPEELEPLSVVLPGRERRLGEEPFRRMAPLVEALGAGIAADLVPPFAFLGHSLGALVAFEVALRLEREGRPGPVRLFAAGCRAPHLPDPDPPVHGLSDAEFRAELVRLGGTPPEILAHEELMQLFLPALRADFELNETYRADPLVPLGCPLTVIGGERDPKASRAELEAWGGATRSDARFLWLPEGHFFLSSSREALRDAIVRDLGPWLG